MGKKTIITLVSIILIVLAIFMIYKFYPKGENENTTNTSGESLSENNKENESPFNNSENTAAKNDTNTSKQENLTNKNIDNTQNKTIISEVSPSGFMGSSMYKVVLYSDGEVYVETFDGNGYEEENIASKELIARKGTSIRRVEEGEDFGMIIIKADEKINDNIGWIEFE